MRAASVINFLFFATICFGSVCPYSESPEVIGGLPIDITQAPWQVSIGTMQPNNNQSPSYNHTCGGTIISDEIIITAAHCISSSTPLTHIHAGSTNAEDIDQGQLIEIQEIIFDELNFTHSHNGFDIAIIKLAQPLCLNDVTVRAIPFATSGNFVGQQAFITGWGEGTSPNQLNGATIDVISNAVANPFYSGSQTVGECNIDLDLEEDYFLSLFKAGSGIASGFGDSGGPAVVFENGEPLLIGIASFGCNPRENNPSIFTDVVHYSDFIENNISDVFPEPTVLTSPISGVFNNGPYFISGDFIVDGFLELSGDIFMDEDARITLRNGNMNIHDAEFRSCSGQ